MAFAYNKQLQCDTYRLPRYFEALTRLVTEILPNLQNPRLSTISDALLINDKVNLLYAEEQSRGRWTPQEYRKATHELGFGINNALKLEIEDVDFDFTVRAFKDAVARTWRDSDVYGDEAQWMNGKPTGAERRKSLYRALKIIAEASGSEDLYHLWQGADSWGRLDPEKAYSTLQVPKETTDEMLLLVYETRVGRITLCPPLSEPLIRSPMLPVIWTKCETLSMSLRNYGAVKD